MLAHMDVHCSACGFTLDGSAACQAAIAACADERQRDLLAQTAARSGTGRITRFSGRVRGLRRLDVPCPHCGAAGAWRASMAMKTC
jgi:hypothetical protein